MSTREFLPLQTPQRKQTPHRKNNVFMCSLKDTAPQTDTALQNNLLYVFASNPICYILLISVVVRHIRMFAPLPFALNRFFAAVSPRELVPLDTAPQNKHCTAKKTYFWISYS